MAGYKTQYIPFTTFEGYPEDIVHALKRSSAYWMFDWTQRRFSILSLNKEAPLTSEEKKRIRNHLAIRMFPFEVIFLEDESIYSLDCRWFIDDETEESLYSHKEY